MSDIITSISYDESLHLVLVKLTGTASSTDVIRNYDVITRYAHARQCQKLLIDVTELRHRYAAVEVIDVILAIKDKLAGFHVARVVGFDGYLHDLLLQNAKRFSLNAENFECFKKAKNWLEKAA
ncbi:hypothetical protein [Pseudoalteromonas ulvae]|uniref:STAS/SEC14 domain-containing protein n=1 Tax=Pseudoalteromonas ulvae TaxID=107327 RepID=A0A244CRY5_PSEDV|nr:hypothetical protein [Pseudoalteromonas ulvae]OUL58246.1 hypothetical protein B1199_07800 [Pseudoalteromonas ulvae]